MHFCRADIESYHRKSGEIVPSQLRILVAFIRFYITISDTKYIWERGFKIFIRYQKIKKFHIKTNVNQHARIPGHVPPVHLKK
jgi:hypothetical protein